MAIPFPYSPPLKGRKVAMATDPLLKKLSAGGQKRRGPPRPHPNHGRNIHSSSESGQGAVANAATPCLRMYD